MNMIGFIVGIAVGGIAGVVLKDKLMGTNTQDNGKQKEIDSLCAENEKIRNRNKELERQVEDLLSELNKVRKKAKESDDDQDDLQDELDRAKRELKNVRMQNEELARKVKEYKSACEALEAEISLLKTKLG